jgi:hypothetical protein
VFEAHGILFTNVDPGSRVFTPVEDHGDFHLSAAQAAAVLKQGGGMMLRYPTLTQAGLPGGAYVCVDRDYSFGHLSKRMRNYVRRGQERCEIRMLTRDELTREGLRLNRDTDGRHGRRRPEFCDEGHWRETAAAAFESPGAFVIGALVDGELASYEVGVVDGEWVYAVTQMSREDLLGCYPNHTLDFAFNQWAFARKGVRGVSIGPVALRTNKGLHDYKLRMGFTVENRNVAVRMRSALQMVAGNRAAARTVELARSWGALRDRLEGLEIVIRGSRMTARDGSEASPVAGQERETK